MSPETVERLFEPFFTTKDVGRGTGLGLATVHGIVTQAGGHIHVSSAPGSGTTFEICLPRAAAAAVAAHPIPPSPGIDEGTGGKTVLVVEDDEKVRGVTAKFLRSAGFRVLEESTPGDALEHVRERDEPIHLVVSDVRMPGLAGPALAKELRRLRPDVRVLFISGYPGEETPTTGRGDGFLDKPFSAAQLVAKARELLAPT
jgi:two-component system cell cycle sensor histidine kinase/response regulator CckA